MNVEVIGKVYHIVDKESGKVVKVGSTIQEIEKRFNSSDYRKSHPHDRYRIVELKRIKSTDSDWYDPKNAYCPFLWHLLASEHLEIVRQKTFGKSVTFNRVSPLVQRYCSDFGLSEINRQNGQVSGRKHVESGHLRAVSSLGGKSTKNTSIKRLNGIATFSAGKGIFALGVASAAGKIGGLIAGNTPQNIEHLKKIRTVEHQRLAAQSSNHSRWHVNRNIVNPQCLLCREGNNNGN